MVLVIMVEKIYDKNEYKGSINIDNASKRTINYYLKNDVKLIVNKNVKDVNYNIETKIDKVKAPLSKNSKVGELQLSYDNNTYIYDLIVKENVKKSSYFEVFNHMLSDIISGVKIRY